MAAMRDVLGDRLRLTVLGCSTAAPHPATPTAGYLVEWADTAVLLDLGQGVVRNLQRVLDPHALAGVIIGHMHADHYLDIVGLRYLFPWGVPAPDPLPFHLPPGGRDRLDALSRAVSERDGFFDAAFVAREYDPDVPLHIGPLTIHLVRGRHYVPAWGVIVEAPDGARIGYTGDTGPSEAVAAAMDGVDLLLVEAALQTSTVDDEERGHLTGEEALDLARAAHARSTLLVHYGPGRRADLETLCAASGLTARPAVDGLVVTVRPGGAPSAGAAVRRRTGLATV
jgi:ribonuclease BN (tRNA processing enzyme)